MATSHSVSSSPVRKVEANHEHDSHHHGGTPRDGTVPWFPSPMEGWDDEAKSFSPRHEASTIELFFDLWFVANLATFTQYHAITNRYTFWSYVAFFIVIWSSWFHVVCFDARFSSDSVWERACKTVHFCAFAAFALAGYKFAPVAKDVQSATPHWIYQVLCFALLLSRAWLGLQYLVTAVLCFPRKYKHQRHGLIIPLVLNGVVFVSVAAVLGGLFGAFRAVKSNLTTLLIVIYVVLAVEFFGVLTISMVWHKLSFKATHISERLGLLGLIIIGEGVIGTTKTITRTMGKTGPSWGASAQVFCIIMILLFMWILYFDRVPKYRFGTVKQQLWMALHLPFHLAILGVVEGSQQLAQARYIYYNTGKLFYNAYHACIGAHLDGQALTNNLTKNIEYFKINESARGLLALDYVYQQIYFLGNDTGVCSQANLTNQTNVNPELAGIPYSFMKFLGYSIGSMFQAFEIDIPLEGKFEKSTLNVALESWVVVYTYFWSAILLLLVCYTITRLLSDDDQGRGHWRSIKRYAALSILSRGFMIAAAIVMIVIGAMHHMFIQYYLASAWILPTVVLMFWIVCISDRLGTMWKIRKERKYESLAHTDGHGDTEEAREFEPVDLQGVRRRGTNAYGYPQ